RQHALTSTTLLNGLQPNSFFCFSSRRRHTISKRDWSSDVSSDLRADERRDKLRKASGWSKYPEIRRCLNGETYWRKPSVSIRQSITYGREPGELKHLSTQRKRKKDRFPE